MPENTPQTPPSDTPEPQTRPQPQRPPALKIGFVPAVLAVCSGTAIFPSIRRVSFFRMLTHLVLLAVLCSTVTLMLRLNPFSVAYRDMCGKLEKTFGSLKRSEKGLVPAKEPEKRRSVYFKNLCVNYLPDIEQVADFKPSEDFNAGVLWTPTMVAEWTRVAKKKYLVMPLTWPSVRDNPERFIEFSNKLKWNAVKEKELPAMLKDLGIDPKGMMPWTESTTFFNFKTNILAGIWLPIPVVYGIYTLVGVFFNALLVSPLYILVFTAFSFIFGRAGTLGMKFKELFVVGIYTGFPGMIIASLYTAFNLPALDYQGVYLLSYLIYSFPVFSRIARELGEENPDNNQNQT